jgi:hypothetical protein
MGAVLTFKCASDSGALQQAMLLNVGTIALLDHIYPALHSRCTMCINKTYEICMKKFFY